MLKLRSEKGFTLVEVICSLSIFSIMFISMMSYEITSIKMQKTIKNTNNNVFIMETLKNNIIYSMTFEELKGLQNNNRFFINNENMDILKIQSGVVNVFSAQSVNDDTYMKLSFMEYDLGVYSLRLSLYNDKQNDTPALQCNFYKGNYK